MWFLYDFFVSCLFLSATALDSNPIKGAIGFPEIEENPKFENKANRTPVFLPSMCRENELYYPGDQKDDWICDCRPGYLFHPRSNSCWPAYRQGPCEEGHYLVLPSRSVLPKCYINPCKDDNLVMWNGKCEVLGSMDPCGSGFPPYVLWVNVTNVVLDCVALDKNMEIHPAPTACPPGCKRSIQNKCVKI